MREQDLSGYLVHHLGSATLMVLKVILSPGRSFSAVRARQAASLPPLTMAVRSPQTCVYVAVLPEEAASPVCLGSWHVVDRGPGGDM